MIRGDDELSVSSRTIYRLIVIVGIHPLQSLVHTANATTLIAAVAMHVHWEDSDYSVASTCASTMSDR